MNEGLVLIPLVNTDVAKLSQMLNPARLQALETWQKENQVTLSQVNGQRKYGGPPDGEEPPEA